MEDEYITSLRNKRGVVMQVFCGTPDHFLVQRIFLGKSIFYIVRMLPLLHPHVGSKNNLKLPCQ